MKIFMLSGPGSSGKTTSLNMLYERILQLGGKSKNKQRLGGDEKDFSDIVIYNNLKIAFFTMGDYSMQLVDAMQNYADQSIDVLICACNDKFVKPYKEIQRYPNSRVIQKSIAKTKEDEIIQNNKDLETLMNLILGK